MGSPGNTPRRFKARLHLASRGPCPLPWDRRPLISVPSPSTENGFHVAPHPGQGQRAIDRVSLGL